MDHVEQPNYPFKFWQSDALRFLQLDPPQDIASNFDAIHASPPCQAYTTMGQRYADTQAGHPALIADTRALLRRTGLPYVIENVSGARRHLQGPVWVCGRGLGLGVGRHRLFECSFAAMSVQCQCNGSELPVYGKLDGRRVWTRVDGSELRAARTLEEASEAMGIDWMAWDELREAIPPVYCEHIGFYLAQHIKATRREAV